MKNFGFPIFVFLKFSFSLLVYGYYQFNVNRLQPEEFDIWIQLTYLINFSTLFDFGIAGNCFFIAGLNKETTRNAISDFIRSYVLLSFPCSFILIGVSKYLFDNFIYGILVYAVSAGLIVVNILSQYFYYERRLFISAFLPLIFYCVGVSLTLQSDSAPTMYWLFATPYLCFVILILRDSSLLNFKNSLIVYYKSQSFKIWVVQVAGFAFNYIPPIMLLITNDRLLLKNYYQFTLILNSGLMFAGYLINYYFMKCRTDSAFMRKYAALLMTIIGIVMFFYLVLICILYFNSLFGIGNMPIEALPLLFLLLITNCINGILSGFLNLFRMHESLNVILIMASIGLGIYYMLFSVSNFYSLVIPVALFQIFMASFCLISIKHKVNIRKI